MCKNWKMSTRYMRDNQTNKFSNKISEKQSTILNLLSDFSKCRSMIHLFLLHYIGSDRNEMKNIYNSIFIITRNKNNRGIKLKQWSVATR